MIRVVVLLLALVAGGAAGWLALSTRAPQAVAVAPPPPPPAMQEVLVASAELQQGQPLGKGAVRWQPWPEEALAGSYIRKSERPDAAEKLVGQMVRSRFVAGEPVREDKLAPAGSGFLASMLAPGKRAVAVRVSAESSAGGFVLPGDRVDVLQTQSIANQNLKSSRTILNNVTVLAVDQTVDESGKSKSAVVGKTATLELDPEQAETIIAAEAAGMLSLVLRSASDHTEIVRPPEQRRQAIRIFRGGRTELIDVQ